MLLVMITEGYFNDQYEWEKIQSKALHSFYVMYFRNNRYCLFLTLLLFYSNNKEIALAYN